MDRGLWDKYCDVTGTDHWCINEGKADADELIELTMEEAIKVGLLVEQKTYVQFDRDDKTMVILKDRENADACIDFTPSDNHKA